jgi:ADP-ribose pyrophosphatase
MPQTYPVTLPREYPSAPLVGVAGVIFNDAGQVLLIQRGRPPSQGLWGLPGGLLDLGESMHDGLHREVMEECGVQIKIGGLVDVFEPIHRDEEERIRYHYVVIDFWAIYLSGEPVAQDDAADIAWLELEQLAQLPIHPKTRRVIEQAAAMVQAEEKRPRLR